MRDIDPVAVIGALREVAETIILRRFNKLADVDVRTKTSKHDLVTVADPEGELRLAITLPALLPGSRLIGEESVSKNPALLNELARSGPAPACSPGSCAGGTWRLGG